MNNKTYIKNTALLFGAMAVTKIVGAVFKIPLANILGGTGMGYFSTAYSIYSPVFAVTAAGVPTVMIRLTAQNMALQRCVNAKRIKKAALMMFTAVGIVGMLLIWLFSGYFAEHIACSPQSRWAIVAIAPAVFFCCIGAVIRGYYEGMSNVMPSAAANVTEAVSRAVIGLVLSYGTVAYAKACFGSGKPFLGQYYTCYEDVYSAALPWAAAAAILSVTLSELCGLLTLVIQDKNCCKKTDSRDFKSLDRKRDILTAIIKNLIPIAAFALVMNCFSFVDMLTVTRSIDRSLSMYPDFFARQFRNVFNSGVKAEELANFMYGSYSGIAMSLFMLVPSFAGMTEKTAIPEITAAWEKQDKAALTDKTQFLIRACALIGCPACFGAAAMAEPILNMLYPTRTAEVSVCMNSFSVLAATGMFMIIASAMSGVFQAIGKAHIPLFTMAGAVAIKAALNPVLISLPEINISGAAISTALSYAFVCIVSSVFLHKYIGKVSIIRTVWQPLISALVCAATAFIAFKLLACHCNNTILTILAIILGVFVYGILLILTGFFRTSLIIKPLKRKKC